MVLGLPTAEIRLRTDGVFFGLLLCIALLAIVNSVYEWPNTIFMVSVLSMIKPDTPLLNPKKVPSIPKPTKRLLIELSTLSLKKRFKSARLLTLTWKFVNDFLIPFNSINPDLNLKTRSLSFSESAIVFASC